MLTVPEAGKPSRGALFRFCDWSLILAPAGACSWRTGRFVLPANFFQLLLQGMPGCSNVQFERIHTALKGFELVMHTLTKFSYFVGHGPTSSFLRSLRGTHSGAAYDHNLIIDPLNAVPCENALVNGARIVQRPAKADGA